ncbi:MAG: cytochrome P450 [Gammaproteobacteria bacterium]|nr:cytochrome P450 [Gammaproteobacteria bacterium]
MPGPRGWPLLGVLPQLRRDPLAFLTQAAARHGDVVKLRLGPRRALLVTGPELIHRVLHNSEGRYGKAAFYDKLVPVIGHGLVTSDGPFWRRQRRLVQPAFQRGRLAELCALVCAVAGERVAAWADIARRGAALSMHRETMALTLEMAVRAFFGTGLGGDAEVVRAAVAELQLGINRRMWAVTGLGARLPTAANRRFRAACAALDRIVYRVIGEGRAGAAQGGALLAMLLDARDEDTGEGMSDRELRDEVMTLLLAGHETSATVLAWTWYRLARHPEWAQRVAREAREVLGERDPVYDDLSRLPVTRMVLEETMRLYPPAWFLARTAVEDDTLAGIRVPAGTTILLSPYVTHRHPEHWEAPNEFRPERFDPQRAVERPRYRYFPFGAGPRRCVGEAFAMMEMQFAVAMAARRLRFAAASGGAVTPMALVTLRPREEIRLRPALRED